MDPLASQPQMVGEGHQAAIGTGGTARPASVYILDNVHTKSKPRNLCRNTLQIRCFYARPRRFLNRVRKFDSCRGHLREVGIRRRGGEAATPPGRLSPFSLSLSLSLLVFRTLLLPVSVPTGLTRALPN